MRPHLVHFTVACVEERLPIPTASVRYYGKDGTKSDASFAVAIGFEREHDGDEHGNRTQPAVYGGEERMRDDSGGPTQQAADRREERTKDDSGEP